MGDRYDTAMRWLAASGVAEMLDWLGIPADGTPRRVSEALPVQTRHVDLLVQSAPARLVHVEFVRRPEPDLAARMLEYRARIIRAHPGAEVSQVALVLGEGRAHEEFATPDTLWARFRVVYLRRCDPAELLAVPALMPLAVLARPGRDRDRAGLLREVLLAIRARAAPGRVAELCEAAAVLAGVYLDVSTIDAVAKEVAMPFVLEETVGGRSLAEKFLAQGRREGREEGREAGLVEGEVIALTRLIRARFGCADSRAAQVARGLVARHGEQAVDVALAATSLDDLDG